MGWIVEIGRWITTVDFGGLDDNTKANLLAAVSQGLAAALALFALLFSLWISARQQKMSRWQLRLQREREVIEWARKCIKVMAEVDERINGAANTASARAELESNGPPCLTRLTALIDEGRLYFPNIAIDWHGREKHEALRGYRHEILDPLVVLYRRLREAIKSDPDQAPELKMNELRRAFISSAQKWIDPKRINKMRR